MSETAQLTTEDINNAILYSDEREKLRYITKFRDAFPNIDINYEIKQAVNDDYYIPPKLWGKAAVVDVTFSKSGCEQMNCFPFSETGPVGPKDMSGFTQTSNTKVRYGHEACFNLRPDRSNKIDAENEPNSLELRWIEKKKACVAQDSLSKAFFNSPFIRSEKRPLKGITNVAGFDIIPNPTEDIPEQVFAEFNKAYCHYFAREFKDGKCFTPWYEKLIGFVLGDMIVALAKKGIQGGNIIQLDKFDYRRPSPLLEEPPIFDSKGSLKKWQEHRDPAINENYEKKLTTFDNLSEIGVSEGVNVVYESGVGVSERYEVSRMRPHEFRVEGISRGILDYGDALTLYQILMSGEMPSNADLLDILGDKGMSFLMDNYKFIFKKINTLIIPQIKRAAKYIGKKLSNKLFAQVWKTAVMKGFISVAKKAVSVVVKCLLKMAAMASTVIGIVLTCLQFMDLILSLWDPYGYGNIFPKEYPMDMSRYFLLGHFEGLGSRDLINFKPEHFSFLMDLDEEEETLNSIVDLLIYIASLEVNSNGQVLIWEDDEGSPNLDNISDTDLLGLVLLNNSLITKGDFDDYTSPLDNLLERRTDIPRNVGMVVSSMGLILAGILASQNPTYIFLVLFIIFILLYFIGEGGSTFFTKLNREGINYIAPYLG